MGKLQTACAYLRDNEALHEALGLSGADLDVEALGRGEHNDNYVFSERGDSRRFVLRVNVTPQPFHSNQVAYEFAALTALERSGCTPQPLYLDDSAAAPGKGAMVISFCEGSELDFDAQRPGDLRCAAQLMADVHAVPIAPDCPLHRPEDTLKELFEENMKRYEFYRSSGYDEPRITKWMERFIAVLQPLVERSRACTSELHIINTETLASHFLIPDKAAAAAANAGETGRFVDAPGYFVDWERPIVGEVAQDLAFFVSPTVTVWDSDYLFPASRVDAFLDDYWRAVCGRFEPGDFEERFRAFLMASAFRAEAWNCRALVCQAKGDDAYSSEKARAKVKQYLSEDFLEMVATDCFGL